jgi:hypothetical protein
MLGTTVYADHAASTPQYLKPVYIGGINTTPTQYGGLVPLIGIYGIDWAAYNRDNP